MELTKEQQAYLDICEKHGWLYSIDSETNEVELCQSSPAGEDFSFTVPLNDLADEVYSYLSNFDVDEHIDMWIEARNAGVSGVPTTRELVDDAEAIERMIEDLSNDLQVHTKRDIEGELRKLNEVLKERGGKSIFVDLPTKDTVWGVIELAVMFHDDSKEPKEYIQAFYDYYARDIGEDSYEPYQADFDKACQEVKKLLANDPRYENISIDANDWLDPVEVDERISDLDAEALRVIKEVAATDQLLNPKSDVLTNEVSIDDLVAQIKEQEGIVFADYWTRDEIVERLSFEGLELEPSAFEKVIKYAQNIFSDHDMDLEEITRYARSFAPKETELKRSNLQPEHSYSPEKPESKQISPKSDIAMGREISSQNAHDYTRNIGRSR